MKPYVLMLSSAESAKLERVLRRALYLAKDVGTDDEIESIRAMHELILNRPMVGGFETEEERRTAYMQGCLEQCQTYGCD